MSDNTNSRGATQPEILEEYKLDPYQKDRLLDDIYSDMDITSSFYIPRLQGVILTLIEGLGFNEKQEKSIKGLIKTFFNNALRDIGDSQLETYRKLRDTLIVNKVIDRPEDMSIKIFGQERRKWFELPFEDVANPDK